MYVRLTNYEIDSVQTLCCAIHKARTFIISQCLCPVRHQCMTRYGNWCNWRNLFKTLGYMYMYILQRISVNIHSILENVGLCSWPLLVVWLFGFMVALHPLTKSGNKLELTVFYLFQDSMPDLHSHFQYNDIQTHMYASQWFLTLFTAKFPLPMVYRIMDLFLCYVSQ